MERKNRAEVPRHGEDLGKGQRGYESGCVSFLACVSPNTGVGKAFVLLCLIKEEEGEKTRPSTSQFQN